MLVVDDSKLQCAVWRKLLEERYSDKIAVETYTDPAEAVPGMAPDIHLLLLDWEMPEMNGIEFIKRFRSHPSSSHVPVIMVTSIEDRTVRYEALEAGATDFLMKPVDHHECRARCSNLLMQYQQYKKYLLEVVQ